MAEKKKSKREWLLCDHTCKQTDHIFESVLTASMSKKKGFTEFSVFLKRVSLLNPRVRTNFVAFPLEPVEGASKFGSI